MENYFIFLLKFNSTQQTIRTNASNSQINPLKRFVYAAVHEIVLLSERKNRDIEYQTDLNGFDVWTCDKNVLQRVQFNTKNCRLEKSVWH